MVTLKDKYESYWEGNFILREIPKYIRENLNSNFELREYQEKAIALFIYYYNDPQKIKPSQLLFYMATGSGKTLLMAADILHLFKQGYRNFLFFVNSTNIIEKTRDNFLNKEFSKYLFNEKIVIDNKEILIKKVPNFEVSDADGINIFFTTVQGLHSLMNNHRENSLTYEDFKDKKIAIISDEAHHINAWTKNSLTKDEEEAKTTWEYTVNNIFNSNKENIMLEYTATVDLDNPAIKEKYSNKILYEYPLKDFRIDRYSKEVNVLEADLKPIERALQAVILSLYRRKIAESYRKQIKPVILMKSKTINDSKKILEEFTSKIRNLKIKDIEKIKNGSKGIGVLERAFKYFDTTEIEFHNLISEIKEEFNENKCLSINTQEESEEKQLKVNSLEDTSNEIRVVFAVDKLNEGWDVLNLFDIVRLYDTRDARKYKPGKTTIAEAQLIGRGARYCPFQIDSSQDKYRRKYDYDLENDLRILEELYYHSAHNPKYIQELKVALRYTGMLPPTEPMRIDIKVKEDFKKTDLWKNGFIFVNEPEKYGKSRIKDISTFGKSKAFVHSLDTGFSQSIIIFETNEKEDKIEVKVSEYLKFRDINKAIIRKVLSKIEFYKFNNLKKYFPELSSISEFMDSLSEITIEIKTSPSRYARLSTQDRFEMSFSVLEKIKSEIEKTYTEYVGTKIFKPRRIEDTVKDRKINVVRDKSDTSHQERGLSMKNASDPDLRLDIGSLSWHIYDENYGTSEEKHLIHFINSMMKKMENKYTDIYLLRNEKLFQLYRFCDGKPIEPDFVLFLKEKDSGKIMYYQLIMEAKGEGFLEKDEWKEQFLKEIEENYQIEILTENEDYRIIGMPFFNYENNVNFIEEFDKKLNLGAFS